MPGGDRTGPMGMGSMTGRAAGYCAGFGAPGYAQPGPGRGFGYGRGRGFGGGGRGWRNMYYATGRPGWSRFGRGAVPYGYPPYRTPDPGTETEALRNQAEMLKTELDAIEKRLSEIEAAAETARD
ncbi:MAG: DUF5320 domain-containing protein [Acidobacteria bacterium]|nr:DUF5320 domain-containing protein [Acidobacteriota bacterium]